MKLTPNQLTRLKCVVTHEMGHYLTGLKLSRMRKSKRSLSYATSVRPPIITISIRLVGKRRLIFDGNCKQVRHPEDNAKVILGGFSIDFKTKRFENLNSSMNSCFRAALSKNNADLTKLLMYYPNRREVLRAIEDHSGSFNHKDLIAINKFYDIVLSKIKRLPELKSMESRVLEFKMSDYKDIVN